MSRHKPGCFEEGVAALYNATVAVRMYDTPDGKLSKEAFQIVRELRAAIRVLRVLSKDPIDVTQLSHALSAAHKVAERNSKRAGRGK